jgi:cysteine synthase A
MLLPFSAQHLIYEDVLDLVHDTPLLDLARLEPSPPRARVLAKWESQNPGGSVKDRIALAMIEEAERRGLVGPGGAVIEPTSGNTGIGLAIVCRQRGYRCILTMPESMSLERRALLQAYGAELVLTPAEEQMQGAVARAEELGRSLPGAFLPHQFDNPENPKVHYERTAEEILAALDGQAPNAFVAAIGTGGTISGVGKRLKEVSPSCRIIGIEPETSATISRGERGPSKIQGIAAGFVPSNYDRAVVDEIRLVSDRAAFETKRAIGRLEGCLVGLSAGANVKVALDVAREIGVGGVVVTVLCDTGERYFSLDEYFRTDA